MRKKNPYMLHRALYRSNTLILEMLIAAFQVFAMLLLTLKTNPFDMQALLLMIARPLCMAGALGMYSKFAPVDRAVYLLSAFLMSISLVILKDIAERAKRSKSRRFRCSSAFSRWVSAYGSSAACARGKRLQKS